MSYVIGPNSQYFQHVTRDTIMPLAPPATRICGGGGVDLTAQGSGLAVVHFFPEVNSFSVLLPLF